MAWRAVREVRSRAPWMMLVSSALRKPSAMPPLSAWMSTRACAQGLATESYIWDISQVLGVGHSHVRIRELSATPPMSA